MNFALPLIVFTLLCSLVACRPKYKGEEFDYRMSDDDAGVVIDRVLEPRPKHDSHHHHHHRHHTHHHRHRHQNNDKHYLKTNRIQNFMRVF
ncbi:unnamed protein product [Angiostrongylus costaricensis]|uniref:Uncharacterized protein n=1 Tax=Angiostrongylus costaricensis TaxID=334426 RepID=A0A0R3PNU7_ANGCS|nr:unnamed protein product [Angiostrongylus costaricensis]